MTGDRNDPSTWSPQALDRLYKDVQSAPDLSGGCHYQTEEQFLDASRREWQGKRDALNSASLPRRRFHPFPSWANSIWFYVTAGAAAAILGMILFDLFRWLTGGH